MTHPSINELSAFINQQIQSIEALSEQLLKAEALTHVTLGEDFLEFSDATIHHYLWVISDILRQARNINECALDALLKTRRRPLSGFESEWDKIIFNRF